MKNKCEKVIHSLTSDEKLHAWGYGEWVEEPEVLEFRYKDYKCFVTRYTTLGHFCGYIEIKKEHPWYGKDYDEIDCDVHGGLTYSEKIKSLWKIGFDCAHYLDVIPSIKKINEEIRSEVNNKYGHLLGHKLPEPTYKNLNFVKCELINLVDQAIACDIKNRNLIH